MSARRTTTPSTAAGADADLGRRQFTKASVLAMLSGVAITVTGCGGDGGGSSTPTNPSPPPGGGGGQAVSGLVSANHGHSAQVEQVTIAAGNDVALDIMGSANHTHSVQLTGAELNQIAAGQRISKTSSETNAHTHTVTFN